MKRKLILTLVGALMVLSACTMPGLSRKIDRPSIEVAKSCPAFPVTALKRCPDALPKLTISQDEWNVLSPDQQNRLLDQQKQEWAAQYFQCAIRHNTGADVYESQVRE